MRWKPWSYFRKPPVGGLILAAIMSVISLIVIVAPFLEDPGSIKMGNDGKVGGHEHEDHIAEMRLSLARSIYRLGDVYCHQIEDRTLFLNGNPMPVCSRDIALFLGMVLGSVFAAVYRGRFNGLLALSLIAPMALDGTMQMLTPYESINIVRVLTGFAAGFAIAWTLNCGIMFVSGDYPASPPSE